MESAVSFVTANWPLLLLALTSGGLLLWPAVRGAAGGSLGVNAAVQLINREKAVLIDIGNAAEFAAGHPAGARHLPLEEVETRLPELVKNKALPVIFVCRTGQRSPRAQAAAMKMGYAKAQALAGGFMAWQEASMPVDKSADKRADNTLEKA